MTIPELSTAEGLGNSNTAKLLRILRMGGFIESERGHKGGYKLARTPGNIIIADVVNDLGGRLFDDSFCADHAGLVDSCAHEIDCSVRSLWTMVQRVVDGVLQQTTLADLMKNEQETADKLSVMVDDSLEAFRAVKDIKVSLGLK